MRTDFLKKARSFRTPLVLLLLAMCTGLSRGQSNVQGDAGVESPFSLGIGAKALGLGNAMTAFPQDPAAFFWNPAGMAVVEYKCVGLSTTTLFEGTQYNYIGYIHPTLSSGTFGFGVMRIGTGGIKHYENIRGAAVEMGEYGYWWGKLTLAYAFPIFKGFSLGANFNADRQVLGPYSTNGFGMDAGFHYKMQADRGFFRGFYLGGNYQNAVQPRMKLGTQAEKLPHSFRAGIAKLFMFDADRDWLSIQFDLEWSENKSVLYHLGSELNWSRTVYLRAGSDNGKLTVGGGVRFGGFQLDYATSRIADPEYFPRSHRFSMLFHIGKSMPEIRRILEAQREADLRSTIRAQMESDRQYRIRESLRIGKKAFEDGDYFKARLAFSQVLDLEPRHPEAEHWLERTTTIEDSIQTASTRQLEQQARDEEKQRGDNAYIQSMFSQGREALDKRDFRTAIEKWQLALERNPSPDIRKQLDSYVAQAQEALVMEVQRLITSARNLSNQERIPEAYKALENAKFQAENHPRLIERVQAEVRRLDITVDFLTNYQEGVQRYSQGDYSEAVKFFEKALKYRPDDERTKELHRNAMARSLGRQVKMREEIKEQFSRGLRLYRDGRYEEALEIWEAALKEDPYNVNLLEAISTAKKKLDTFRQNK